MTEHDIPRLLRQQDRRAIAYLYDKYSDALYGTVLRMVGDEALAADIMQEAFVKVWRNGHRYDAQQGSLFTWLLNIFRRTAIDKMRSKHWQQRQQTDGIETGLNHPGRQAFMPDHIGLQELVGNLEDKYREVIDLVYFHGYTQQEVHQQLSIPLGTVKSRLRIGLRQLRQFFSGIFPLVVAAGPTIWMLGYLLMEMEMDKEKFLQSGLLEQFVLGLTDESEDQLVQQHLQAFPELQKEVDEMRRALEQYAAQHAIPPPKHLRGQVLSEIDQLSGRGPVTLGRRSRTFSWSAVAIIALAIVGTWLFRGWQQSAREVTHLEARYAALVDSCEKEREACAEQQNIYAMIQLPSTQKVLLTGTPVAPGQFALAYWNEDQQQGWLDPSALQVLPEDKQYQVWADVHGEMISIGLLPTADRGVMVLNYLEEAESINITIEPLGGSDHPTVSQLVVNGLV
jgi:RNA polymerase sigma factor (sigma-70 family)